MVDRVREFNHSFCCGCHRDECLLIAVARFDFLMMNVSVRAELASSEMCHVNVCSNACVVVLILCIYM